MNHYIKVLLMVNHTTKQSEICLLASSDIYQTALSHLRSNDNSTNHLMLEILDQKLQELTRTIFDDINVSSVSRNMASSLASSLASNLNVPLSEKNIENLTKAIQIYETAKKAAAAMEKSLFSIEKAPDPFVTTRERLGPISDQYSILKHALRPIEDNINIAQVFGVTALRGWVAPNPKRQFLHNIIAQGLMKYAIPQKQYKEVFLRTLELLVQSNPNLIEQAMGVKTDAETKAMAYLESKIKSYTLDYCHKEPIEDLLKAVKATHKSPSDIFKAVSMRFADNVLANYISMTVEQMDFSSTELGNFPIRSPQTSSTRKTYMINGGVASGKGTAEGLILDQAYSENVNPKDLIVLNVDSFKEILLSPEELSTEDRPFFSGFSHDEAGMIRDLLMTKYMKQLEENIAPHLYVDQVWTTTDIIEVGQKSEFGIDITIVQIPVESSIKMAYSRGESTGRFEPRDTILKTHAGVPDELLRIITYCAEKGLTNLRLKIVANVAKGFVKTCAIFNMKTKEAKIHNVEYFLEFFKKSFLNKGAKKFNEIYTQPIAVETLITKIDPITKYFSLEIPIISALNKEKRIF